MAETIKIAVCDDEKNIRSYLVSLIKKQGGECGITEYASADAYLSDGKGHDIMFLDIEMGGSGAGLDGMGLARHIRGMEAQKQPIIIFVTGYEKYVYDAFDVGAFQYLVKPVAARERWCLNIGKEAFSAHSKDKNNFYTKKATNKSNSYDLTEYYEKERRERELQQELRDKEYFQHKSLSE